jgi:hypothetical protein
MSIEQTNQLILLILNSALMTLISAALLGGAWLRQNTLAHQLHQLHLRYKALAQGPPPTAIPAADNAQASRPSEPSAAHSPEAAAYGSEADELNGSLSVQSSLMDAALPDNSSANFSPANLRPANLSDYTANPTAAATERVERSRQTVAEVIAAHQKKSHLQASLKKIRSDRQRLSKQYRWSHTGMLTLHMVLLIFGVSLFALALRSLLAFDGLISTSLFLFTLGSAGLLAGTGCILADLVQGNSGQDSLGRSLGKLIAQLARQWRPTSLYTATGAGNRLLPLTLLWRNTPVTLAPAHNPKPATPPGFQNQLQARYIQTTPPSSTRTSLTTGSAQPKNGQ